MAELNSLVGEVHLLIKPAVTALNKLRALIQGVNQDFAKIGAGAQIQSSLKDISQTGGRAQQVLKTVAQTLDQASQSSTGLATGMRRVSEAVAQVRVPDIGGALQKQVNQAKDALKQNTREIRQSIVGVQQEITATEKLLNTARARRISTINETIQRQTAARDAALSISREIHQAEIELDRQRQGRLAAVNRQIAQLKPPMIPPPPTAKYQQFVSVLGQMGSAFQRIALFSIAAGVIVRGFFAIVGAIRDAVSTGITFNATIEQSRLAMAAILASGRELASSQGAVLSTVESYPTFLAKAAGFQKELLIRNIETLGTYEELQTVFERVLAFSAQQKASDSERLQLAQNLLNAGKLLGLQGEQLAVETRQILTLENNRGQMILQSIGLNVQQLRTYKEQGTLVQVLNERLHAFSVIAKDVAITWMGLTTSASTFVKVLAGEAFAESFAGLKTILKGFADQLLEIQKSGGLSSALGLSDNALREAGKSAANLTASFLRLTADGFNATIGAVLELAPVFQFLIFTTRALQGVLAGLGTPVRGLLSLFDLLSLGVFNLNAALSSNENSWLAWAETMNRTERNVAALATGGTIGFLLGIGAAFAASFFVGPFALAAIPAVMVTVGAAVGVLIEQFKQLKESAAGIRIKETISEELETVRSSLQKLSTQAPQTEKDLQAVFDALNQTRKALAIARSQALDIPDLAPRTALLEHIDALSRLLEILSGKFEQAKRSGDDFSEEARKIADNVKKAHENLVTLDVEIAALLAAKEQKKTLEQAQAMMEEARILLQTADADLAAATAARQARRDALLKGFKDEAKGGKEATKTIIELATAYEKLASVQAGLAAARASITGDFQTALDLQLQAVDAETQREVDKVKQTEETKGILWQASAVKKQEIELGSFQQVLQFAEQERQRTFQQIEAEEQLTQAKLEANNIVLASEQNLASAQLNVLRERSGTLEEQIDLITRMGQLEQEQIQNAIRSAQSSVAIAQQQIDKQQAAIQLTISQIELGSQDEAQQKVLLNLLQEQENKLADLQGAQTRLSANATTGQNQLAASVIQTNQEIRNATTTTIRWGDVFVQAIEDVLNAAVAGTLKLKNALTSFGLAFAREFISSFAKAITAKVGFDTIFKKNFSGGGLLGIAETFTSGLESIFSNVFKLIGVGLNRLGIDVGRIFGSSAVNAANVTWSSGWNGIFNSTGVGSVFQRAGAFGGQWGSAFAIAAAEGFVFSWLAKLAGGGKGARMGAGIGGFLLGPLGGLFGGAIGSFFDSVPTKGTEIRQATVKWLKKLDVEFADEINSSKYGFEWIEAYRKATGLSFLEASREFIPKEFTKLVLAGLDKQLLALGIVSTAKMAEKLGKDLEQTGVTFANMIAQNLVDPEKISKFIADLVQKGGLSLGGLVEKLIEVFNKNLIGVETFKTAIEGAIGIFLKDFPAAAEVARQAFDKAFADGVISAEEFKAALEQAMKHVMTVVEAAADAMNRGIAEGLSAEEATELFLDNFKAAFRAAAIDKFMKDFFGGDFFKDINLVDKVLSDEDIQKMATRFKIGFEKLKVILKAAGLLPDIKSELATWQDEIRTISADAIRQGIEAGMSAVDAAKNFEKILKNAVLNRAIEKWSKDFWDKVFNQGDFSREFLTQADVEEIARRWKISYEEFREWARERHLLPDDIEPWIAKLKTALESIPQAVGSSLTTAIVEALEKADFKIENVDVSALQKQMEDIVARAVLAAVVGALVEAFVVAPMMAALAPFVAGLTGGAAAAGATVAAGGITAGAALFAGGAAGAAMLAAATVGLKLLWELMQTPEFEEFLALAKEKFAPGAGAGAGVGSGGAPPETGGVDILAELKSAIDGLRDAIERLAGEAESLADSIAQVHETRREARAGVLNLQTPYGRLFLGEARDYIKAILKPFGLDVDITDWLRIEEIMKGLPQDVQDTVLGIIKGIRGVFARPEIGVDLDKIIRDLIALDKATKEKIAEIIKNFLDPIMEFIEGPKPENPLKEVIDQFQQFFKALTDNRDALEKAGKNVDDLLARLTTALGERLAEAVNDLVGQFSDLIPESERLADQLADMRSQFGDAVSALQQALDTLLAEGLLTPELEAKIREQIKRLLGALPDALRAAAERFLEPVQDFIDRGQSQVSKIQELFNEYDKLRQKVIDNAVALAEAGIDVNDVLTKLSDSLVAQIAKMRAELLEPITTAIERLAPADLRDLADILGEIAGAGTLEDLARIRDAGIANIEERLRREEEAARKATEENIKLINIQKDEELERLREIQAAEEERMRSQMTQMDRLVSLREQQLNEEISAIDEALRGVEDLRTSAQDLRKTAADFLLSTESPFTPRQRFFEAQRQFAESVTPDTFRALVEETRNVFASSEEGQRIIDDALAQLLIMAGALEGRASEQEQQLQAQKKSLTALLGIEDTAVEIARLTKELGLTGTESLAELRTLRGKLDEQLEGIRKTFEQETKNLAAIFDAAIAREQAALELRLQELQEAAVGELQKLRLMLDKRFFDLLSALNQMSVRQAAGALTAGGLVGISGFGRDIAKEVVASVQQITEDLFAEAQRSHIGGLTTAATVALLHSLNAVSSLSRTIAPMVEIVKDMGRAAELASLPEIRATIRTFLDSMILEFRTALGVPLQHGGIVTRPTLALLGEKGPERVTPLSPYNSPRAFPSDSLKTDSRDVVNEVRELRADLKKLQEVMAQQSDRPIQVQVTSVLDGRAIGRSIQTGLKQGDIVVPRDALSTRVF